MIDMVRRSSEVIDVDYNTSCSLINVPLVKNLCNLFNDNLDVLDCISDLRIQIIFSKFFFWGGYYGMQ